MREKLGLSNPRNSGFDRGGPNMGYASLEQSDCILESQDLSAYWKFAVDSDGEREARCSVSNSLPFGVGRRGSAWMRDAAELPVR